MTEKPPHFLDKANHIIQRMMGVNRRMDPRLVDGPVYGSFSDRVIASAIDVSIIVMVFQDLFSWMSGLFYKGIDVGAVLAQDPGLDSASFRSQLIALYTRMQQSGFLDMWLLNSFAQSIVTGICLVTVWNHYHITPGKWIVGLIFVDVKTNQKPTLKQYIIRYLSFYLSMPIFMLGFASLMFSKRRQAIHDMIAGTAVIYSKKGNVFRRTYDLLKSLIFRKKKPSAETPSPESRVTTDKPTDIKSANDN